MLRFSPVFPVFPAVVFVLLASISDAAPQFGTWHPSPSRPDVWYASHPLSAENWVSGRAEIERQHPGLDFELCSITTPEEADLVRSVGFASLDSGIYIGITDFFTETEWRWLGGTAVTESDEAPGQPNNDPNQGGTRLDYGLMDRNGWQVTNANGSGPQDAVCVIHSEDCDGNQIPDLLELWNGAAADQNSNGIIDSCEAVGTTYCAPTVNSSGLSGAIHAGVSATRAEN